MKLICPSCGAIASAESWLNDAKTRDALALAMSIPAPVTQHVLSYISLFRPGKSALGWGKTVRLLGEIKDMVSKGYVSQQGKPDKNCTPFLWAKAIEQMLEQRHSLSLPMKSHNYLKKIAWDLANSADYQGEKKQNLSARQHTPRQGRGADPGVYDPEKIKRNYEKHMQGEGVEIGKTPGFGGIVKGMD